MSQTGNGIVFQLDRPLDGKAFKAVLAEAGYKQMALAETVALACPHDHQDVEVVYRRVKTDTPYHMLVRLFWLGRTVSESVLQEILPALDLEALTAVGMLNRRDRKVQSAVKITPYHDLYLGSDFGPEIHRRMPADHVLGVGAASLTLAGMTVRRQVETVLDLGTGAGIQAFLAARHSKRVIGTDTNRRALNFAGFNAKLNDIDGLEWRWGSLYEPAAKQKFDLIVANPPFVISPESRFVFRDTQLPGDEISEQVIRGAGVHLNEGGFAGILFNWHHHNEDDWSERPLSWVKGSGCDSWLLRFSCEEPLAYAAQWLSSTEGGDSPDYGRHLDEWTAYYEKMGIEKISAGSIVMRKRSCRANWSRSDTIEGGKCLGSCSDQIERIFAAEDLFETLSDDRELLNFRLKFDKRHRLEHRLTVEDGRWVVGEEHLRASEGVPFAGKVDMYVAQLLAGCDGSRTLGELITDAARRAETDAETMIPTYLKVIRKLMKSGFLSLEVDE